MDDCVGRKDFGAEHTVPVAYLVCNFLPAAPGKPALLTHDDVVTMFHEFGHGLHHMLTRVGYPSIAGINGVSWDAVELPSQFMENFAWRPEVLAAMARHYETGAPLPADKQSQLLGSRTFQAGLATMRQLEFALFDFRLHAEYDPARGARVHEILAEVRDEVAVFAVPEWNRFPHNFGHIFAGGYAAGYYSYKWAEVLSADAFAAFEEQGVFDKRRRAALPRFHPVAGRSQQGARCVRRLSRPPAGCERAAAPAGPRPDERRHRRRWPGPQGDFSIATWNVNTCGCAANNCSNGCARIPRTWWRCRKPRCRTRTFPHPEFTAAGYHSVFSGQKTYNGVALLSRHPMTDFVRDIPDFDDPPRRVLAANIGGFRVINLYVPNGQAPGSEKFAYKLKWLEALTRWLKVEAATHPGLVVLGDFNVAPEDRDVHDPAAWVGCVHVSPEERAALEASPASGWWMPSGTSSSRRSRSAGGTIDRAHFAAITACASTSSWYTSSCCRGLTACRIDVEPRRVERASDHTPVVARFQSGDTPHFLAYRGRPAPYSNQPTQRLWHCPTVMRVTLAQELRFRPLVF